MSKLANLQSAAVDWLPDVLMVSGAAAISAGAGMVYPPASWIVGGCFALFAGIVLAKGAK